MEKDCRKVSTNANVVKKETKIEHYIKRASILLTEALVSYSYEDLVDMGWMIRSEEEENEK